MVRLAPWSPARPDFAPELPRVVAHRGASAIAPENTLAALRRAKELGAPWVEFDVKLTRDGVPILLHDDRLERTTNGRGRVADATLQEIQALDAGGWFDPAFRGEPVPTLAAALELCAALGLGINLEIKPCPGRAVETAERVVDVLRAVWPAHGEAPLISSFDHPCLELAAAMAPDMPRGYLARRLPRDWAALLQRYGCATLHLNQQWVGRWQIARLREAGVPLLLYTVNDPVRAAAVLEAGAASVFTDRVGEVLAALGRSSPADD
jgi:glycerophosphoryl diester phosphodiesterase